MSSDDSPSVTLHFPFAIDPPPQDEDRHADDEKMTRVRILSPVGVYDPEGPYRCDLVAILRNRICVGEQGMAIYRMYICQISPDRKPFGERTAAVCKHARDGDNVLLLQREAEAYAKMKHLQGDGIPRVIGFYAGTVRGVPWAVLVTEDCGEPFARYWWRLSTAPLYLRIAVAAIMLKIHKAGVEHADFNVLNIAVVKREGRFVPTIVDFDGAYLKHDWCDWQNTLDGVYIDIPPQREIHRPHCAELRRVWFDAELWNPAYIEILDRFYPPELAKTPQDILQAGLVLPPDVTPESMRGYAIDAIRQRDARVARRWELDKFYEAAASS